MYDMDNNKNKSSEGTRFCKHDAAQFLRVYTAGQFEKNALQRAAKLTLLSSLGIPVFKTGDYLVCQLEENREIVHSSEILDTSEYVNGFEHDSTISHFSPHSTQSLICTPHSHSEFDFLTHQSQQHDDPTPQARLPIPHPHFIV